MAVRRIEILFFFYFQYSKNQNIDRVIVIKIVKEFKIVSLESSFARLLCHIEYQI